LFVNFFPVATIFDHDAVGNAQGGDRVKKLWYRICLMVVLVLSLTGCSAIRGVGNGLFNSFKGFNIHFP
jgi:predicted small secreted protein